MQKDEKRKILLVEDDSDMRDLLSTYLTQGGYEVLEAENGSIGESMVRLYECDVVISDIRMPEFSGVELLNKIKSQGTTPVILMTGCSDLSIVKNGQAIGADGFIEKPFQGEELLSLVKKVLASSQGS